MGRHFVVVAYDLPNDRRRQRLHDALLNYGTPVQYSVFECLVDPAQWARLRHRLESIIDPGTDSLRYYYLGANWRHRVEHIGAKDTYDPEGPLVV